VKAAFLMAGSTIGAMIHSLIPPGIAQLVRLGIKHGVDRSSTVDRTISPVILYQCFIDFNVSITNNQSKVSCCLLFKSAKLLYVLKGHKLGTRS
jgi:hypothetical protein